MHHVDHFNRMIRRFFGLALKLSWRTPRRGFCFLGLLIGQVRGSVRRSRQEKLGVHVPALLIASITKACNLRCVGCYSEACSEHRESGRSELSLERWGAIFGEAETLGTSIIMIAGGEPFLKKDFLRETARHPAVVFPVFTNGLLVDEGVIAGLRRQRHVIPVVSLEGFQRETDARRGSGTYERILGTLARFRSEGIFFGVSITTTRRNLDTVTTDSFIRMLIDQGCGLFFFVEFTPVNGDHDQLTLLAEQKNRLNRLPDELIARHRALFVAFPGDEDQYGGCLAAGRGFVHINAFGDLEACPFAPFADLDVRERSLAEALRSPLLAAIREHHDELSETRGGCALWNKKEWVDSLVK